MWVRLTNPLAPKLGCWPGVSAGNHEWVKVAEREVTWDELLAQLVVFKEESGGCAAVPRSWGKNMNSKFGVTEAPDWLSKELGIWTNDQRTFGKAFKKPASQRSKAEKTNAKNTTERRVALLDGIGFFT